MINNTIDKKEAKAFLYGDDGKKLTYEDEKGKTKDLSAEDLNSQQALAGMQSRYRRSGCRG